MSYDRPDVPIGSAGCLRLILLPVWLPILLLILLLILPVALVKLVTQPFERPITRSPADVARILRGLLDGTGSGEEWDAFVCIPIADKRLDEIRKRCADLHDECRVSSPPEDPAGRILLRSYISAAGQNIVHAYIRQLEGEPPSAT